MARKRHIFRLVFYPYYFLSFNNCPPPTLRLHFTSFKLRFLRFLKITNDLLP
ncbi:hypothetical protein WN944_002021 [Citrus x changshan-huyou]|uniref:Uncharacterized protein n=1 Tax=Citrus x changshan-huyou TaxID=2935761 RepID=A0AAP0MFU2_9ROSI